MNSTFRHVLHKFAIIFFDDILIYSSDWASHLHHLREVFTYLRAHHLFANQSKCEFSCTKIGYLGHNISREGVVVDPDKIQAINEWPILHNVKALWGFLGLCGYYWRFMANYSKLATPLTELLRKDAFVWIEMSTQAFQRLRHALTRTPVL